MLNLSFAQIRSAALTQEQIIDLDGGLNVNCFIELSDLDSIEILKPRFKNDMPALIHYNNREDIFRTYAWIAGKWQEMETEE